MPLFSASSFATYCCVVFFHCRQAILKGRRKKVVTEEGSSSGDDADDSEDVSTHQMHTLAYYRLEIGERQHNC